MDESSCEDVRIQVSARIRPCPNLPSTQQCVRLDKQSPSSLFLMNDDNEQKKFDFDCVLGANVSQEEVFRKVAKQIVNGCLDGYNGTILAYGQTNSGKTYTMQGVESSCKDYDQCKGIMPRSVEYLFAQLEARKTALNDQFNYQVDCSFVELYNEQIFDLLSPSKIPRLRRHKTQVQLENTHVVECEKTCDVLALIDCGAANRRQAETLANRKSSRSHSIMILNVFMEEYKEGEDEIVVKRTARLNLVDLAGAERLSYTKAEKERMKEAIHINKSLSTLGRVIRALSKHRPHVPYRDSILTHLLADSLGGNSRTAFIVTLHPDKRQFDTTASSLQFSQALKTIQNKVWINQESLVLNKTSSLEMTAEEQLSVSRVMMNEDENSMLFESIEQLTNTLDAIEKQKQLFVQSFNQLKLREAELSHKLDAYKNGTQDSLVDCNNFTDSLINTGPRSVPTKNKLRRSVRRQTIFGNTANFPINITIPLSANRTPLDFNEEKELDQSARSSPEINDVEDKENQPTKESPRRLPSSKIPVKSTMIGKPVNPIVNFSQLENLELTRTIINSAETMTKLNVVDENRLSLTFQHNNTLDVSNQMVIIEDEFTLNSQNEENNQRVEGRENLSETHTIISNPTEQTTPVNVKQSVLHHDNTPDLLDPSLIIEDEFTLNSHNEDKSSSPDLNKTDEVDSSDSLSPLTDENQGNDGENEEEIGDESSNNSSVSSAITVKRCPMVLRTNTKTKKFLAAHFLSKKQAMPMEEREIIAKAVNTYKDEIFSTGITNVRRQQIWKQICAEHNAKCPERIDVLHARRTWNYIRKRALKLADDPSQVDKITNVDRLVLSIVHAVEERRQQASNQEQQPKNQGKPKPVKPELLLKQAAFVERMIQMRLIPEFKFKENKITYRPMNTQEVLNPQIELPMNFEPSDELMKLLGHEKLAQRSKSM